MYFGTQYYRPPFPGSEDWDRDLSLIAETGFNIVKLWAVWSWVESTPGKFRFDDLDRIVERCEASGLKVVINLVPEGAPYWLERAHPDARYCSHDGEKLSFSGAANLPSGGWPGLCRDKPEVEALSNRFLSEVAARYADHGTVIGYDVWNEPHIDPAFDYPEKLFCYCEHSRHKFAAWLQAKYGTVEALNAAWHRAYADWEDAVAPIRFGTYPDMMDWRLFWLGNHTDWLTSRVDAVKAAAPEKFAMTHVPFSGYLGQCGEGGLGQTLTDEFWLADRVEAFGLTSFPKWLMGNDFLQHLMNVELVAEAAEGKPFWQSELQSGGGLWGIEGNPVALPEELRLWNWNAIMGGAKGVLYWQWRPEPSGMESPGFGLTALDGGPSERTVEAGRIARRFLDVPDFHQARRALPANGIYVSRTADLFAFAAARGEKLYAQALYGVYTAACDAGVPVRFVHGDHLSRAWEEGVKTLYVPASFALSDAETAELKAFAAAGGKLVLEACSGLYDEHGTMRKRSLIGELFGTEPREVAIADRVTWLWQGEETARAVVGSRYRQRLNEDGSGFEIVGRHEDGAPAACRVGHGAGEALWIGTLPSVAYTRESDEATGAWIAGLFDRGGYPGFEAIRRDEDIVFRLFEGEAGRYLLAVNYGGQPGELAFRAGRNDRVIGVPPRDGVVVRL